MFEELFFILDIEMFLFVEKRMRGGFITLLKYTLKPNNKYMKWFDDSKPSKYMIYFDANNLYGWAMSQYLP